MGIPATFLSIILLAVLGLAVILGARYARRNGHLQSRGSRYAVVALVAVLAVLLWVGPAMFLVSEVGGD